MKQFAKLVVAQLVERTLPTPEVGGSNPIVGKIYTEQLLTINCIEKMKMKKKRSRVVHFYYKQFSKERTTGRTDFSLSVTR